MTTAMPPSHSRSLPIPRHLLPARSLPDLSLHYNPPSSHHSDSPTLFHEDGVSPDFGLRFPLPTTPISPYSNAKSRYMDFYFDLAGGSRGKPKARLILSAETRLSRHVPTYLEGSPLKGALELNFEQSETVASITAMISGHIITGPDAGEKTTFLEVSQQLWARSMGEPELFNEVGPESSTYTPASNRPSSGKLRGNYRWDFDLRIPPEVVMQGDPDGKLQTFRLPQTLVERDVRASVVYNLVIRFERGKFRSNYEIPARFGYIPLTKPSGPFSPLRERAYSVFSPLLGPTIDHLGWHPVKDFRIRGTAFNTRIVEMNCKLFLAKPLSYTRGSVIPLALFIEGMDGKALDLLSSPEAINLRLRRKIKYRQYGQRKEGSTLGIPNPADLNQSSLATWWPSTEVGWPSTDTAMYDCVCMHGELQLRPDLQPSAEIAHYSLQYHIAFLPFDIPGFESEDKGVLAEHPVEIVVCYGPGSRPHSQNRSGSGYRP